MNSKEKQNEFMYLYEPYHTGFVKYCKAKSYGIIEYEDLVNESITRAFESFNTIKNKAAFAGYLYGIAKNIIKAELRKRKTKENYDLFKIDRDLMIVNQAEQKFEIEVLYKALAQLPENQKEAVILFEISGYSIKEIAEMQNSGISAIKQRLKRGRTKLSEILLAPEMKAESLMSKSSVLISLFF